ncbi:AAA family ATPase [Nocardiopsis sp. MT53]|uniref:AAA family ATPase n=1 Tax=Nocardiopsis changdeensis TaxID=2831969 RepID=A0ABX8BYC5_9ACTN|nr:AAA family ATPase [Nocardiopsis sp. MT53]QUX26122.1 AAA family ATPase [Nocardiopsis changdeensis]QYX40598.1 AAA family ATPase [Nocardiopsis sp. MT53]
MRHWSKDLKHQDTSSTLHLMKSRRTAEGRRSPELVPMDPKGPKAVLLETEYLFLFHTVADTLLRALNEPSVEADLALTTSSPNQARKIMELFLQFKSPKQGINLANAVEVALKDHPALAARIVRFVHSGSHRSADPNSVPLADPTVRETSPQCSCAGWTRPISRAPAIAWAH